MPRPSSATLIAFLSSHPISRPTCMETLPPSLWGVATTTPHTLPTMPMRRLPAPRPRRLHRRWLRPLPSVLLRSGTILFNLTALRSRTMPTPPTAPKRLPLQQQAKKRRRRKPSLWLSGPPGCPRLSSMLSDWPCRITSVNRIWRRPLHRRRHPRCCSRRVVRSVVSRQWPRQILPLLPATRRMLMAPMGLPASRSTSSWIVKTTASSKFSPMRNSPPWKSGGRTLASTMPFGSP
mmetsp:Transcript_33160/g.97836  ORF Transcript_33160/g.97836 Transcript_33160/m.97836 type:complete len:235 (-) Transcript_33160:220-924(-)